MTELVKIEPAGGISLSDLVELPANFANSEQTAKRTLEFFAANIRNLNTRKAYGRAVADFARYCDACGITQRRHVQPLHVAAPAVKLALAATRMLFDWLVFGQTIPTNPASADRGSKYSVKKGKTPVLSAEEARTLLDSIDNSTLLGLRDRTLIAMMTYSFARVGAAAERMRIEDVYTQGRRTWLRLHEKGGKRHEMPAHHKLESYLHEYIEAAGLAGKPKAFFFRPFAAVAALSPKNRCASPTFTG